MTRGFIHKREPFYWFTASCGLVVMAFVLVPLVELLTSPSLPMLKEALLDKDVVRAIRLSISTAGAAALIAFTLCPQCKDYMIAGHRSVEIGHRAMYDHMGLEPLLDLNMRLGEGTGAALAMSIVEASCKILDEMITFAEAEVAGADKEMK